MFPIQREKKVGACAMASAKTDALGEEAILTKYGLAKPKATLPILPYPGANKWKLLAPGTPILLNGPLGLLVAISVVGSCCWISC